MKKIFTALCCFWIFVSSIGFGVSLCSKIFVSDALVLAVEANIDLEDGINSIFQSSSFNVNETTSTKLKEVAQKVAADKDVKAASHELVKMAVNDLISGEVSEGDRDLSDTVKKRLEPYAKELSETTNNVIGAEEVKTQLNKAIDENGFQNYKSLMKLWKLDAADEELSRYSIVNTMQGNMLFFTSLGIMIVLSVIVIVLNKEHLLGLLPLGIVFIINAIFSLMIAFLFSLLMKEVLSEITNDTSIGADTSSIYITAWVYAIIAIVCFNIRRRANKRVEA